LQLARVLVLQKDLVQARAVARQALSALSRLEIITGTAGARTLLAEIELTGGRPKAGLSLLEPVLEEIDQLPIGDRITVWHLCGLMADALGDRSQARRWLDQAVRAVEAQRQLIPGVELRASAFEGHVRVYRDRIAHALRSRKPDFETLFVLVESARARAFRERHSLRASEPRTAPPTAATGDKIAVTGAADDKTSAAAVSDEKISATGSADQGLRTGQTEDESADAVRARLGSLVARMERLQYDSDRAAVERLIPDLNRQISVLERRLMSTLRRRSIHADKDLFMARGGWKVAGSAAVERTLSAGEVLVEYFVLPDRILALVLGNGRPSVVQLEAAPDALRPLMQSFHVQLESLALTLGRGVANLPFLKRAADGLLAQMYEALLRPLGIEDASGLVIVPHRFLHQVPFECLRTRNGYLIDHCVVRRTPSADFLLRNSAESSARARRSDGAVAPGAVGEAASGSSDGTVVLSGMVEGGPAFVESELQAVRGALKGPGVHVLRDAAAAELLDAFGSARWIHLSTHGAFRGDNPLFSRLSTRGDALFLIDLLERTIDSELVVLSACNSGQVFAGEGDDLSGVAHGFLAAGAQNLVASIWRVHDRATRDWMVEFYGGLSRRSESPPKSPSESSSGSPSRSHSPIPVSEGSALPRVHTGDVGEAVRTASIRTREMWDHPFFWGAFCLYG
jgi:CHAT domain-containing protein